jgi:integrase
MGYELYRRDGGQRWHAYFIDREGVRQRKSTRQTDKRRAAVVADEWYRRLADPTYSAANATSLQDAAKHLIEALKRAKRSKSTTGHFYPTKLSHLARVWGPDMPLARVDAKLVDGYIATRESEGAMPHTVSKELTALRQLLKHARRRGEFDKELSQVMPIGYATGYKPRTRRLTIEEAWQFIGALPPNVARYVAFVLCTTARDAAVARARRRHFIADKGIEVVDLKTKGSARLVPHVSFLAPFAYRAFDATNPDAHVAPGLGSVRHAFDRATKKLGIAHVSPNDLRRSVAHWMLERGIPRDAAAAFMGHANTKMLDAVYGKLDTKELGETIRRSLEMSVEGTWKTAGDSGDSLDAADSHEAYLSCAGAESNRRHGDFQSSRFDQETPGKVAVSGTVRGENVDGPSARAFRAQAWLQLGGGT